MKSMTGFGFHEYRDDTLYLSVELKAYNNRYLDIGVSLPPFLSPTEPRIRSYLSERVGRGKVEVYVRLRELEEEVTVHLDRSQVQAYGSALRQLRDLTGTEERIRLEHFLSFPEILQVERERDIEQYWPRLSEVLEEGFRRFEESRVKEGTATARDIANQLERLRRNTERISSFAEELEERIQQNLRERFAQVMGDEQDESRLYAEAAVLLARYSINEEIERIRSHLANFDDTAQAGGPVGKKLDFICQELNREINTIGSKNMIQEVSDLVVDSKDALENVREQLRNVE